MSEAALSLLRQEEEELETRLAKVREAIRALGGAHSQRAKLPSRKKGEALGEVVSKMRMYGAVHRIRTAPLTALKQRFGGRQATMKEAADLLRERFDLSPITIRAHVVFAVKEGILKLTATPGRRAPVIR